MQSYKFTINNQEIYVHHTEYGNIWLKRASHNNNSSFAFSSEEIENFFIDRNSLYNESRIEIMFKELQANIQLYRLALNKFKKLQAFL